MRIAAVDYGKKRIGLSISDERKIIALPLKLVDAGRNVQESSKNILHALTPYLAHLEKILIGLPLMMNGTHGEMAKEIERFTEILSTLTTIPIEFVDERLTSAQAERELKSLDYSRKERKSLVDSTAATLLLQAYLDRKTGS